MQVWSSLYAGHNNSQLATWRPSSGRVSLASHQKCERILWDCGASSLVFRIRTASVMQHGERKAGTAHTTCAPAARTSQGWPGHQNRGQKALKGRRAAGVAVLNKMSSGAWRLAPKMSPAFLLKRLTPNRHRFSNQKAWHF